MNQRLIVRNFLRLNKILHGNSPSLVKPSSPLLTIGSKRWFKLENGRHMSSVEEVNYHSFIIWEKKLIYSI